MANGDSRLTDAELDAVKVQSAGAADLARVAGLDLAAEIAEIRREQAAVEAARLRFKHGEGDERSTLPEKSGLVRAERGVEARRMSRVARAELEEVLKSSTPPRDDRVRPSDPSRPVEPARPVDPSRPVEPTRPEPSRPQSGADFTVKGQVLSGTRGVSGLTVEALAVAGGASTPVAQTVSAADGSYALVISDVPAIRERLGIGTREPLTVEVVARKERTIVARSDQPLTVREGASAELALRVR